LRVGNLREHERKKLRGFIPVYSYVFYMVKKFVLKRVAGKVYSNEVGMNFLIFFNSITTSAAHFYLLLLGML
jgi:hypothetical protein